MSILAAAVAGLILWLLVRVVAIGIYTVDQNERAVKTRFGRAIRIEGKTTLDNPRSSPAPSSSLCPLRALW